MLDKVPTKSSSTITSKGQNSLCHKKGEMLTNRSDTKRRILILSFLSFTTKSKTKKMIMFIGIAYLIRFHGIETKYHISKIT